MKIFTKTFEISDEEFELLIYINKKIYVEYRDTDNGTYEIARSLYNKGFLADIEDAWHITYELSDLGIEAVEQLTSKQYVRSEVLEKLI